MFRNRLACLVFGIDILWFTFIAILVVYGLPIALANPTAVDVVSTLVAAVGVTAISTFLMSISLLIIQFYYRKRPDEESQINAK